MKEPSRLMRNLLSTFKFNCSNEPCDELVSYYGLDLHKDECLYSLIDCGFCQMKIYRKDVETHQEGCLNFVKYKKNQLELENSLLKESKNTWKENFLTLVSKNDSLRIKINSLKRQNDDVNVTKNSLFHENKRIKTELEKETGYIHSNNRI